MYNISGQARARGVQGGTKTRKNKFYLLLLLFTSKRNDVIEIRPRNTHQPDVRIGPSGLLA